MILKTPWDLGGVQWLFKEETCLRKKIAQNFKGKLVESWCTLPILEENYDCDDKDFQSRKKVIFGCAVDEEESAETHSPPPVGEKTYSPPGENNGNEIVDEDDDRHSCSSDGSYVKVMAAFNSSEDLGADLTEFAKEVRLAPDNLTSFSTEDANVLSKQVGSWLLLCLNES